MRTIDLSGKVAVVTGGAGQVGRGIVKRLAEAGADVAIAYHKSAEYAQELKGFCEKEYGVRAGAFQVDVTDEASVNNMRDAIEKELGPVDIIVINAMVRHEWKKIMDQTDDVYLGQFKGFVLHAIHMIHAFVPHMVEQKWGRVIAINTECAMQMFPYQSAYAATKRNLDGIMKILAKEVGENNITVNQVAPGWVWTDASNDDINDPNYCQDFPYIPQVPLRRRCTDKDIGDACVFFASELANCISGVYMPVNGGNTMPCI